MPHYMILTLDRDAPPSWLDWCETATPGPQDSGRCRWRVRTGQPEELEGALWADEDVLAFSAVGGDDDPD